MITTDGDHRFEHRQKMETSKAKQSKDFRNFEKIYEDFLRFEKIYEDFYSSEVAAAVSTANYCSAAKSPF